MTAVGECIDEHMASAIIADVRGLSFFNAKDT
jgi:hypothetical protein